MLRDEIYRRIGQAYLDLNRAHEEMNDLGASIDDPAEKIIDDYGSMDAYFLRLGETHCAAVDAEDRMDDLEERFLDGEYELE